jgi:hypothetical protein
LPAASTATLAVAGAAAACAATSVPATTVAAAGAVPSAAGAVVACACNVGWVVSSCGLEAISTLVQPAKVAAIPKVVDIRSAVLRLALRRFVMLPLSFCLSFDALVANEAGHYM